MTICNKFSPLPSQVYKGNVIERTNSVNYRNLPQIFTLQTRKLNELTFTSTTPIRAHDAKSHYKLGNGEGGDSRFTARRGLRRPID